MLSDPFTLVTTGLISLSVILVFMAIIADFILFNERKEIKKEKRSIVATGTMFTFYFVYFLLIAFGIGSLKIIDPTIMTACSFLGTGLVVFGSVINVLGRLKLHANWSNHIKIYDDQTLVTSGVFGLIRHPLYASLMLMLLGGSLAYLNIACAFITFLIFIPFMTYRAKQEEVMLMQEFVEYSDYRKKTGMFFPKFWR
jgi:protein-S-isoprenylcysteine O-methyltransferase Ste14